MNSLKFNLNNFDYKLHDRMEKIDLTTFELHILLDLFNNNNSQHFSMLQSINGKAFKSLIDKGIIGKESSSEWVGVVVPSVLFIEDEDLSRNTPEPTLIIFREKIDKQIKKYRLLVFGEIQVSLSDLEDIRNWESFPITDGEYKVLEYFGQDNTKFYSFCEFIKDGNLCESSFMSLIAKGIINYNITERQYRIAKKCFIKVLDSRPYLVIFSDEKTNRSYSTRRILLKRVF